MERASRAINAIRRTDAQFECLRLAAVEATDALTRLFGLVDAITATSALDECERLDHAERPVPETDVN